MITKLMMKSTLFLSILFFSVTLGATDWDLFPPHQKMYFFNEEAQALDWFEVKPSTTPYVFTSDKYTTFSGTNGCPFDSSAYFSIGMLEKHKWSVEELYNSSVGTIFPTPANPWPTYQDQFVYHKNIGMGQFWNLNISDTSSTYSSINITFVYKELRSVFGTMDSVRVFSLSGTKYKPGSGQGQTPIDSFQLVVSKNYGVVEFVPFQQFLYNPRNVDFTSIQIVGVERFGVHHGITPPTLADFIQYQQGDILNWENTIDTFDIKLFQDSITALNYLPQGIVFTFNRRIEDITGPTGISYQNNLKRSIEFNKLTAYTAPPLWGDFHFFDSNHQRMVRNESFFGIDHFLNDTIFRTSLQTTDLLLETTNCNHLSYIDFKEWEVYDNRYGLAEFGKIDMGIQEENRLVVAGPCPGIDSSLNCSDLPANIDCDNGGLSNYLECLLGNDPFDPTDDKLIVLPIELMSFNATLNSNDVLVQWSTALEINSAYFDIERSHNNTNFQKIGTVQASENTQQITRYQFVDPFPPSGRIYYRLKMVDLDNSFKYSHVNIVHNHKEENQIEFFPNPVKSDGILQVITDTEIRSKGLIQILDISGKVIRNYDLEPNVKQHTIQLDGLAQGAYLVKITFDEKRAAKRLVIH